MFRVRCVLFVLAFGSMLCSVARGDEPVDAGRPSFADCRPEQAWVVPAANTAPSLNAARLPSPVAERLAVIGGEYLATVTAEDRRGETCAALYGQIYTWMVPGGRQLFGIRLLNLSNWAEYRYFLFEPKTGALSPSTVRLTLVDWRDEPPERRTSAPGVSYADLDQDGRKQIVIAERKRNGTVYSCLIYHYFEVGTDFSLTRVMALETNNLQPFYGPGKFVPAYKRRLTVLGGNHLRIDTALGSFDEGVKERPMGYAILASDGPGMPFRVVSRHPRTADDDHALVETSRRLMLGEEDDDRFFREGCPDC